MPRREFANSRALQEYARRCRKLYAWEGTPPSAAVRRRLSPDRYEIVDVLHSQGVWRAMLFPKLVLRSEWDRDAPPQKALRARAAYRLKPLTAPSRSRTGSKCTAAGLG
jgi:hypothetical protein